MPSPLAGIPVSGCEGRARRASGTVVGGSRRGGNSTAGGSGGALCSSPLNGSRSGAVIGSVGETALRGMDAMST